MTGFRIGVVLNLLSTILIIGTHCYVGSTNIEKTTIYKTPTVQKCVVDIEPEEIIPDQTIYKKRNTKIKPIKKEKKKLKKIETKTETIIASWYGPRFHGRKMANGNTYDMYQLTAAHRTLPLGSKLEIVNSSNGKSVVVEITDRGPFIKGRHLDLSYGAAKALGMVERGVIKVIAL